MWTRPTIPWKLSCENVDGLSRQQAFAIFTLPNSLVDYMQDFRFLGLCMVILLAGPFLIITLSREQMLRWPILRHLPEMIRLVFLFVFVELAIVAY